MAYKQTTTLSHSGKSRGGVTLPCIFFCSLSKKIYNLFCRTKIKLYFCNRKMNQLNNTTMEAKNVKNGIICSIARIEKETEKALQLTFSVELYGADFVVRKQWMPKSMINEVCREDDRIFFTPKNDWILDKKTREYCAYVAETFDNVRHEIKTYLSRINTEVIKRVSA